MTGTEHDTTDPLGGAEGASDDQATTFTFQGILVYRDPDDPNTFRYVPGDPLPERTPAGKPAVTLLVFGQGGMLQLAARWDVPASFVDDLTAHVRERFPALSPALVRIAPAPAAVSEVTLLLGDGSGAWTPIGTSRSSGFPPYAAVFNVQLDDEGRVQAQAAMSGRPGFLSVVYDVRLTSPVTVRAVIAGDVAAEVGEMRGDESPAEARAILEAALEAGHLILRREDAPRDVPEDLWRQVERQAFDAAVAGLLRLAQGADGAPDAAAFEVSAALTTQVSTPARRAVDVARWYGAGTGLEDVQPVGGDQAEGDETASTGGGLGADGGQPVTDAPPQPRTVALDFDARQAPVAFVQVRAGDARGVLRGPAFEPVTLDVAGSALEVETHYTQGVAPFHATVERPTDEAEWSLAPADLGLSQVVVDGTRPQAAGVRRVRAHVQVKDPDGLVLDDRLIFLRDDHWIETWYVVSKGGGVFEFEWTETLADGSVAHHRGGVSADPTLIL